MLRTQGEEFPLTVKRGEDGRDVDDYGDHREEIKEVDDAERKMRRRGGGDGWFSAQLLVMMVILGHRREEEEESRVRQGRNGKFLEEKRRFLCFLLVLHISFFITK